MERAVYDERDPRLSMSAGDAVELATLFDEEGTPVWLDGGWAVDAVLGEQTREHDDLDLVVAREDVPRLIAVLERKGYEVAKGELPMSVVLLDAVGRQIDVHPVAFDASGDGIYRMDDGQDWAYPARGFAGTGLVLGKSVRCLTPEVQVLCHAGYDLAETDRHDLGLLRERFGV
jgi:lincosamide nucleotidyltransferase A/C/D/E